MDQLDPRLQENGAWASLVPIDLSRNSFYTPNNDVAERGEPLGRNTLESLPMFSRSISRSNDLCSCCLSYSNAEVIISELLKSPSADLSPFSKALFSVADSHLCSILGLKSNSGDQFVPYLLP